MAAELVQFYPNAIPLAVSGAAFVLVAAFLLFRHRIHPIPGAWLAAAMLLSAALWALSYAVELTLVPFALKVAFNKIQYIGATFAAPLAFTYILRHVVGTRVPDWVLGLLLLLPVAVVGLIATDPIHHLVWREFAYVSGPPADVENVTGPAYTGYMLYNLVMIAGSVVALVWATLQRTGVKRAQTLSLLAAVFFPGAAALLNFVGYSSWLKELLIVSTIPAACILLYSVGRYDLFTLTPIAQRTTIAQMREGVLVVNATGSVVDANPVVTDILGIEADRLVGSTLDDVSEEVEVDLEAPEDDDGDAIHQLGGRYVEISTTPLEGRRGRRIGKLVLFDDVTGFVERGQRLKQKNERLEQFATVLTHDLRNPLAVADSYLDLYRETGDEEHAEEVAAALDRADRLVEDVLAWSRSGRIVTESTPIDLESVVQHATHGFDDGRVRLEVTGTTQFLGDSDRVLRLFENLVRNSIDHAVPTAGDGGVSGGREAAAESITGPATVRVGPLEDGFYLEDDGPGIPPSERDRVFGPKFSTRGGNGFGLALVQNVVEAHGWEVTITSGSEGGARFEFTGVELL